jgi:SNF2 family DNA or RNA helicase
MKTKPFAHQQECFDIMKDKDFYGLFAEQGLGKTKIVLDILSYNREARKNLRALVVCPNTLIENWADEIVKHSNLPHVLITGSKARRVRAMAEVTCIYVINYEATRIFWKQLKSMKFDYLILDESTAVKNHKSQQSKACFEIAQTSARRIIMTGTPVMNSPLDLFAQYKILDISIFGHNFYRFRATYAIMGGYMNKLAVSWKNMHNLKLRAFACAIRKTKAECLDLPDKLYQVVKLDMTKQQMEIYKKLKEEFIYEFKDVVVTAPIMLTRLMRFSQITAGFTKDIEGVEHEFAQNPKVAWIIDFIDDLDDEAKVVVFCRFRREISMLEDALRQRTIQSVSVHGGTEDRIDRVRQFNTDKRTKVFIGQIQTAGIGINLTAASYCVFMSNSYSYGHRAQAEDRLHRIGQVKNVTYIDLLMRNTIDVGIHRTLGKKENLAAMVTGDLVAMV